jgi:hypothetical protein
MSSGFFKRNFNIPAQYKVFNHIGICHIHIGTKKVSASFFSSGVLSNNMDKRGFFLQMMNISALNGVIIQTKIKTKAKNYPSMNLSDIPVRHESAPPLIAESAVGKARLLMAN